MKNLKFISQLDKITSKSDHSKNVQERDESLVWQNFIKGDDQSLIFIYRKYLNVLFRYGQQFCDSPDFIQDCIQELFFELIDKRHSLSSARSIKAYLLVSLKRKILREIKKQDRMIIDDGFTFSFIESSKSINKDLKEEDYNIIYSKVNELPLSQREVIFLHFYEGLSYADIAEIMKVKVATARTLTYRALDNLEEKLGPYLSSFYLLMLMAK